MRAGANLNDWIEVDSKGRHRVIDGAPEGYYEDPAKWWNDLREAMAAGVPGAAEFYSTFKARLDLGGLEPWVHIHLIGERVGPRPDRDPPFCCGSPMWASPDGWACRVNGRVFPYGPSLAPAA